MRFYSCGKCRQTVTRIKWKKEPENFTATPICLECWERMKAAEEDKSGGTNG